MRTLDFEEIQEVRDILRERHPLYYSRTKVEELIPIMRYCPWGSKAPGGDGPNSTRETEGILKRDLERSDAPSNNTPTPGATPGQRIAKPVQILGFGTVAYFDFHRYLMILYGIMVVLLLPSLTIFLFYGDGRRTGSSFLTQFSIGNLGFSSALCKDVTLAVGNLTLTCPAGQIGQIVSFGVIPSEGKINDACLPNSETKMCEVIYDQKQAKKQIEEVCLNREYCTINVKKLLKKTGPEQCTSNYAQFYTQVYCEHSEKSLRDRDKLSIWFSIQILLTTLAYIAFLYFLRRRTAKEYTEWDMQTTTISDYSMEYPIPDKIFAEFRDKIYPGQQKQEERKVDSSGLIRQKSDRKEVDIERNQRGNDNLMYAFKVYLKNELEGILQNTEHVRFNDDSLIQISHIHLGFDHKQLHYMLAERGNHIKNENHDAKEKIEQKIVKYIEENKEHVSTPKTAYIILETEEAFHRAMKFNSRLKCGKEVATRQWKGTNLILRNVKEPTNISFEYKYKSKIATIIKMCIVGIILTLALMTTCFLIFYFQDKVNRLNRQYPEVNWDAVIADSSPTMLKDYAMLEFYNYETSDKSDITILMQNTDNLQCFCDDLVEKEGYVDAYNKEFDVTVLEHHVIGKVCNDYLESAIFIKATAVLLPLLIIIFNVILKTLAIILVQWLGFENKTIEISIIQSVVFLLMFFNSALAILLINANIKNFNDSGVLFNGLYSDFSDDWYDKIAQFFITPMIVQLIYPINAFLPGYIIQKLQAMWDRGFTDPKLYKTKWNLAYDYADVNSGTEHLLYEKYPRLLCIIFVSSFYGFQLPLLPIIVFISLIISYIVDKLVVAYYHRKPPLYDDTLNVVSIHFLKWAAFLYIAIAYWVLTNMQLFANDLRPIEYQAQIEYYDHHILEWPDTVQEHIVLIVALLILLYCLGNLIFHWIEPLFASTSEEELMEFEDLKVFSQSLDQKALHFWVNEEKIIRQKYGYKLLFDDFYKKIKDRLNSGKDRSSITDNVHLMNFISDATNYDLLYQNHYAHQYAYIPVTKRKGDQKGADSNFTRKVLDFPYHQKFNFKANEPLMVDTQRSQEETKNEYHRAITSVVV